jgi:hypothetical protein
MRRIALTTAALAVASTMVVAGLVAPAGAASRSTSAFVITGVMKAKKPPPNVNVNAPGPAFSPTSVTGKKESKKACKKNVSSFTISNLTSSSQDVDLYGSDPVVVFATIPVGDEVGVCGIKKLKTTPAFYLKSNTSSVLTVTIT